MDEEFLWDVIRNTGLNVKMISDAPHDWDTVLASANYAPVAYLRRMVAYQAEYMRSAIKYIDLSMIVYFEGKPVGVWPLCVRLAGNKWICGSSEGAVRAPIFVTSLSEKMQKEIMHKCMNCLKAFCVKTGQPEWQGEESVSKHGVSLWHRLIMEQQV